MRLMAGIARKIVNRLAEDWKERIVRGLFLGDKILCSTLPSGNGAAESVFL